MICRIADFIIEFQTSLQSFENALSAYTCTGTPQASFSVTDKDIEHARTVLKVAEPDCRDERAIFYTKLMNWLPKNDAMFFHSALIKVKDVGIAFTALSGTGKTTHALLWQKLLGDKMTLINGDKPIFRLSPDGSITAYGAPWQGKENFGVNSAVPLRHLCFIERSETNSCEKITPEEALKDIFSQIYIPHDMVAAAHTLELVNRILNSCTIWKIKCNKDIEAAAVAYNTIFKGDTNET